MKIGLNSCTCIVLFCLFFPASIFGQTAAGNNTATNSTAIKGLFESDKVLELTLSGNTADLVNDRNDNPAYHPMLLQYQDETGNGISLRIEMKTRGHFRKLKENCFYPPLQIHFFKSDTLAASVFSEQDKLKLVMPCKEDQYVIREWLVYKIYNLVTSKSFRARLVQVKLYDLKKRKTTAPFYGILLESEKQMAKRNNAIAITRKLIPEQMEPNAFLKMAAFEYLIGNTDWGIQYLQNIKLVAKDSNAMPTAVPYDFDHAGLVDAPYAMPAEELMMNSVRERRYRGFCLKEMKYFEPAITFYNGLKKNIYDLYTNCVLLDAKYIKATLNYFDEFYKTINDPKKLQKEFSYPCDKNGTGNVVIKGLKQD